MIEDDLGDMNADAKVVFEHLHGVYDNVKEGFRLIEAGRPEAEAAFHWHLLFWSHWGFHNAEALRIIHYYVALS